ncbi:hypothetical protein GCM10010472_73930 [Pseudonocardia halophobica]|uniref:Uncharacterized protein n=1 Tax=Pseudonocardia halophobica TaxID=29401 RepID=A0A9W6P0S9_9PSEU|nr:hypothetical protein GCM10017577_69190 [Pseudonocardia halophobica]
MFPDDQIKLVECPECGQPAEIIDEFRLDSTSGPVEHVKIHCLQRHWFTMLAPCCHGPATDGAASAAIPPNR